MVSPQCIIIHLHIILLYYVPCLARQSTAKFLMLFSQLSATPYGNLEDLYGSYDDNNEVAEEEAIMKAPSFVSSPLDVVVNQGETIRLPCIVSRSVGGRSYLQYSSQSTPGLTVATIVTMKFSINCISI